ncbi:Protein of unknown function [Bacillus cereus]|uniref:Uncharacterized protein n=1 Tax=Bacillus wiedmannii TaxID=1890302 RepID=A0AB37YZF2_9BACI|nr:Protein of unknown function [Bacillus cereus]SCC63629.1 Protein of unknown function [Bacillus wiedmannii]SCL85541.1 Protein of unknown function [Bacillus wiedmannii]SCN01325.1 Protein of unknown function [Bacillus wiedmannii]SCN05317.1 Protein of unknown function [Bacillus wiedmannii]
MLLAVLTGY